MLQPSKLGVLACSLEESKMNAGDVMVTNVITVRPHVSVQDIAKILLANRISAVPVIDEADNLVGIVSEGDLIHRVEVGTNRRRSWWLEFLADKQALAQEFVKSHGRRAIDVMTRKVVTVNADMPLSEIAVLFEKRGIKRVPVVDNGKIVGIVSRADLVRALAGSQQKVASHRAIDDSALCADIIGRLRSESWWPGGIGVMVHDGTVELLGIVESQAQKDAIRIAVEAMPGVQTISDHLSVQQRIMHAL
jgi:CBS domain-containing protein